MLFQYPYALHVRAFFISFLFLLAFQESIGEGVVLDLGAMGWRLGVPMCKVMRDRWGPKGQWVRSRLSLFFCCAAYLLCVCLCVFCVLCVYLPKKQAWGKWLKLPHFFCLCADLCSVFYGQYKTRCLLRRVRFSFTHPLPFVVLSYLVFLYHVRCCPCGKMK